MTNWLKKKEKKKRDVMSRSNNISLTVEMDQTGLER